jgi:Flp pilus assembly protein TadD
LTELERFDESAQAYANAYELAPSARYAMRGYLAASRGGIEDPAALLKEWVSGNPEDWGALNMLGMHYEEEDQLDKAISTYEQAIDTNDENFVAMNNLAWLYSRNGDSRAEAMAEEAYALQPNVPVIADTLGWIRVQNGDYAGGLPILQEAAANAQGSGDIQYHLAYTLNKLGDVQGSAILLRNILASETDFSERDNAVALLSEIEENQ